MNSFPTSTDVDTGRARLEAAYANALRQLKDPTLSEGERDRLRHIVADLISELS